MRGPGSAAPGPVFALSRGPDVVTRWSVHARAIEVEAIVRAGRLTYDRVMHASGVRFLCCAALASACASVPAAPDAATRVDAFVPDAPRADTGADASAHDGGEDASIDALFALDPCAEGVLASLTLARIAPLARDTDTYRPPLLATRTEIEAAVAAIAADRFDAARGHATSAGYILCRGTDADAGLVLLRPAASATGHAWVAVRVRGATRALVIEAPHPVYDAGTLAESVTIFATTSAQAVVISGTHRCASDRASGCNGTADACGPAAPVRESDMAHAIDSVFHAVHTSLVAAYPAAWFVGVHGFVGPGASVSNGTASPTLATSRSARLAIALHTRFGADVTTCNDFGDATITTLARVCGTEDVQGRLLNGSAMECTAAAASASDRFVHVEQAPEYRPDRAADLSAAILEALAP